MRKEMGECQTEKCFHISCNREQRIWLNKKVENNYFKKTSSTGITDVTMHPYCIFCGSIKNISDDRPKKLGHWINILSKISKEYKISKIQKRLVIKELGKNDYFDDFYSITGSEQKEIFVKTIRKYCKISEETIYSYIS